MYAGLLPASASDQQVAEIIRQRLRPGKGFPVKEAISIARRLADGIGTEHERGIVHRDLRPSNILLTRDGRVKILDFGQGEIRADNTQAAPAKETLASETGTGAMGTVGYMSPEKVNNLPVDRRTDLFSFGIVLYEMVTGTLPFPSDSARAFYSAILYAHPRDFGDGSAPKTLKAIVQKLLQKGRADRYHSVSEVQRDLEPSEVVP